MPGEARMVIKIEIEPIAEEEVAEIIRECIRAEIFKYIKKDQRLRKIMEDRVAASIAGLTGIM